MEPRWLTLEEIIRLHQRQVTAFGGVAAIREFTLLESAVYSPQQRFHYGELRAVPDLAAAYTHALTRNHPFADGNKRVAFHAALVFLRLHGHPLQAPVEETTGLMLAFAAGTATEQAVRDWFHRYVT